VRREFGVEKRVIAVDELEHAAIFAQDVVETHFRFFAHGFAEIPRKFDAWAAASLGNAEDSAGVDRYIFDVAGLQPLPGEIFDERQRAHVSPSAAPAPADFFLVHP